MYGLTKCLIISKQELHTYDAKIRKKSDSQYFF